VDGARSTDMILIKEASTTIKFFDANDNEVDPSLAVRAVELTFGDGGCVEKSTHYALAAATALKHLPGMHDQFTHDPTKGILKPTVATVDNITELVLDKLPDFLPDHGMLPNDRIFINPTEADLVAMVASNEQKSKLTVLGRVPGTLIGLYDPVTRKLVMSDDILSHTPLANTLALRAMEENTEEMGLEQASQARMDALSTIAGAALADRSVHVRIHMDDTGKKVDSIRFDTKYAGVDTGGARNSDQAEEDAYRNIERAKNKLSSLGYADAAEVLIWSGAGPVDTTLKHLPGQHDQASHNPYKGRAVATAAAARIYKERVKAGFDPDIAQWLDDNPNIKARVDAAMRNPTPLKEVDTQYELTVGEIDRGGIVSPDDRLYDAGMPATADVLGSGTHIAYLATVEDPTMFGLSRRDANNILVCLEKDQSGENLRRMWGIYGKIFDAGCMRSRIYGNEYSFESKSIDTSTLRRMKRLMDTGKLTMGMVGYGYWSSIRDTSQKSPDRGIETITFTYEELMAANTVPELQRLESQQFKHLPTTPSTPPIDIFPWAAGLILSTKADGNGNGNIPVDVPSFITALSKGTAKYEQAIREAWEAFKRDPSEANAHNFIQYVIGVSSDLWPAVMMEILNVPDLSPDQKMKLEEELTTHHNYLTTSLLPDVIKGIQLGNLDSLDYRTIFLYAGALWAFGSLATVMFDGLSLRDLGDLFLFVGPNDEATCTGEHGCQQHVGKAYTVAEILARNIIPGHLRCITNCRHMLLPIASFPEKKKKHLPGMHDQQTHDPTKGMHNSIASGYIRGKQLDFYELDCVQNEPLGQLDADSHVDYFLRSIVKQQGYDGLPEVVSEDKLNAAIEAGDTELYRGVRNVESANRLRFDPNWEQVGQGVFGNGTYTMRVSEARNIGPADALAVAATYGPEVIRMALRKGAKVILARDAIHGMAEEDLAAVRERQKIQDLARAPDGTRHYTPEDSARLGQLERIHHICMNEGRWAASKGYDAIMVLTEPYMIILNRTAVRMQRDYPYPQWNGELKHQGTFDAASVLQTDQLKHLPGQHDQRLHGRRGGALAQSADPIARMKSLVPGLEVELIIDEVGGVVNPEVLENYADTLEVMPSIARARLKKLTMVTYDGDEYIRAAGEVCNVTGVTADWNTSTGEMRVFDVNNRPADLQRQDMYHELSHGLQVEMTAIRDKEYSRAMKEIPGFNMYPMPEAARQEYQRRLAAGEYPAHKVVMDWLNAWNSGEDGVTPYSAGFRNYDDGHIETWAELGLTYYDAKFKGQDPAATITELCKHQNTSHLGQAFLDSLKLMGAE